MTGTLFVVATPIGNLEDITLRALRILREVAAIAAEDTRRTARLLARHGIDTATISFHEHNTRARLPQLISRLEGGASIALVTDAGTPSVSDPGLELVQACVERGIPVDPIPGASAPLAAAVASGFPLNPWTLFGFPPARATERKTWLRQLSEVHHTVSFFEAPHRIRAMLTDVGTILGDRPIMLGRELTKAHQEFLRGSAEEILKTLGEPRGEFTIVVGPVVPAQKRFEPVSDAGLFREFCHITENVEMNRRIAVQRVADAHGISPKEAYAAIERGKKLV